MNDHDRSDQHWPFISMSKKRISITMDSVLEFQISPVFSLKLHYASIKYYAITRNVPQTYEQFCCAFSYLIYNGYNLRQFLNINFKDVSSWRWP